MEHDHISACATLPRPDGMEIDEFGAPLACETTNPPCDGARKVFDNKSEGVSVEALVMVSDVDCVEGSGTARKARVEFSEVEEVRDDGNWKVAFDERRRNCKLS